MGDLSIEFLLDQFRELKLSSTEHAKNCEENLLNIFNHHIFAFIDNCTTIILSDSETIIPFFVKKLLCS
jgi:hypothetical protein